MAGDFLDLSCYGYRIESELGANRGGGRVTYLAHDLDLNYKVVIKQFQFARLSGSWVDYDAYQREIEVLRGLQHPGVPRYLTSFQTEDGFCMVQEYKPAMSLAESRSFSPQDLRKIAVSVLEILVYLQNRIPPIIHRDIKPDNILIDDALNVYLVDFGFARIGDGEVGVSSVVKGTLGFMPPEQLFNRELTEASDLYGLGMTLICLLTRTKTDDIGQLVDISYKVKFKHLVPKLSQHWVNWLDKMVEPRDKDRFPNAKAALQALPDIAIHPPEVRLSQSELQLKAHRLGEVIHTDIIISNPVPDIVLSGRWSLQPDRNDGVRPLTDHPWIRIDPLEFSTNQVQCRVQVSTRQLIAGATYHRVLLLHTNAFPQEYSIPLTVETAALPVRSAQPAWIPLLLLLGFTVFTNRFLLSLAFSPSIAESNLPMVSFAYALGAALGFQSASWILSAAGATVGTWASGAAAMMMGASTLIAAWLLLGNITGSWSLLLAGLIPGMVGGWGIGLGIGATVEKLVSQKMAKVAATVNCLCVATLACGLSLGLTIGFHHTWLVGLLALNILVVISLTLNAPINYAKRVADFRKTERDRIQP